MIISIVRAIGDLADRTMLGILFRSLLITLAIFVALGFGAAAILVDLDPCTWLLDESCRLGGVGGGVSALLLTLLALWFLFPAIGLGVVTAYVDRAVGAVETRHYLGAAATARRLGIVGGARLGLISAIRVLVYNLVALPLYVLLLVTGIGPLILFVLVNGAAFGRDLAAIVMARHLDARGARLWLRATKWPRLLLGVVMAGLFLIPFINLIAPLLGAAAITHFYHRRSR